MDVLPAIDLRGGKVVRLELGDYDRQTQYSDDPAAVAQAFAAAGAKWIHVVDLDAALTGKPGNTAALRAIRQAAGPDVRIEFGGGARSDAFIDTMLDLGVSRVVVGSAALKDWAWFERLLARPELAGKIALGLDARDGKPAVHGWTEQLTVTAVDIAARTKGLPLGAIVYTDISRDGMLSGINVPATSAVAVASGQAVIASGGLKDIEDVRRCREAGCAGVIIGKAYYEGRVDLVQAISVGAGLR